MLLQRKVFFIKEKVQVLKLSGEYDILEPDTNQTIGLAKEEPGGFIKLLRFFIDKRLLPNRLSIYDSLENNLSFYIKKPFSFLRSKVIVYDKNSNPIGYFKSKFFLGSCKM